MVDVAAGAGGAYWKMVEDTEKTMALDVLTFGHYSIVGGAIGFYGAIWQGWKGGGGFLGAINAVNPLHHLKEAVKTTYQAANSGDYKTAGASGLKVVVMIAMAVAGSKGGGGLKGALGRGAGEAAGAAEAGAAAEGAAAAAGGEVRLVHPRSLRPTHGIESRSLVEQIKKSMRKDGYTGDPIQAVELDGALYIKDGHHRAAAAVKAPLPEVPVKVRLPFSAEDAAQTFRDFASTLSNRF